MTNSRFEALERRCQKIRRGRIAKVVSACVTISLLAFTYFYFAVHTKPSLAVSVETKEPRAQELNTSIPAVAKEAETNQTIPSHNENNLSESQAIDKNQTENPYDTLVLSPKLNAVHNKKLPTEEKIYLAPPLKGETPPMEDFLAKPEPKKTLAMSVTSLSSEEALLKNFHSSNAFGEAIALAHFYFEKKEYIKTIAWCKESSKLKPVSDEPWILYAKAKFHLGERAEAIRSLELFLGYVNSKDVRELLTFYKGQQ